MADHDNVKQLGRNVIIWDETLRDGEQSSGLAFALDAKAKIAKWLAEDWPHIIDIGVPLTAEEQEAIRQIISLSLKAKTGFAVKASSADIDGASNWEVDAVFLFAPTSKLHIIYKFHSDYKTARVMVLDAVQSAQKSNLEVYFISEDKLRSEREFVVPVFKELHAKGVDKVIITDTLSIIRGKAFCFDHCG